MKPKTVFLIFMTAILTSIWCSAAWAGRLNFRDQRQTRRIIKGVRSGEITRPEARRLKNEQRHINRAYHRALADGRVNRLERHRLDKMQDRASRHIYRAKHNLASRGSHRYYRNWSHRAYGHHHRAVVYNNNVNYYYPVPDSGYADDGYEFSLGLSNIGWQFAFSGWNW